MEVGSLEDVHCSFTHSLFVLIIELTTSYTFIFMLVLSCRSQMTHCHVGLQKKYLQLLFSNLNFSDFFERGPIIRKKSLFVFPCRLYITEVERFWCILTREL